MATLFWTLLTLYPFAAHSQSGDDGESIDTDCWSLMTIKETRLVCVLKENDIDICEEFATLCPIPQLKDSVCSNATLESSHFTFCKLSPVQQYKLHIHLKGGRHQIQNVELNKMVKIPPPQIENATYKHDEAVIHIRYMHEYVKTPEYQVEFWGDHSNIKEKVKVKYQLMRIGRDKLRDSEIYKIRVRARPVDFFSGSWTKWSVEKSFRVNHTTVKDTELSPVLGILLSISTILLVVIVILILRRRKEIQACIFPAVPDPKATLAQIHRQKEFSPVSFSPEIFKDINIYPVVYTEEKQFTSEFGDDQSDTTKSCDDEVVALNCSCPTSVGEQQDEDEQRWDLETSHLKIEPLDESVEDVHDNPGCQSVVALQGHSKDETYVTMSSLYKTQ